MRGVLDPCDPVGGDFLESVPSGGDVYVLPRVPRNWDDTRRQTLLTNCHEAVKTDATPLIIEHLIPAEAGDDKVGRVPAVGLDINMMAVFGGREGTWDDFRSPLARTGSELLGRWHPLPSDFTC